MTPEERRHLLRDPEDEDDWAWRRRIRGNATTRPVYRALVFVIGLVLVVGGLALVPLPGPGWLIVILGIAVWASEFEPASRLLDFVKAKVRGWEQWLVVQAWWVKVLVGVADHAAHRHPGAGPRLRGDVAARQPGAVTAPISAASGGPYILGWPSGTRMCSSAG